MLFCGCSSKGGGEQEAAPRAFLFVPYAAARVASTPALVLIVLVDRFLRCGMAALTYFIMSLQMLSRTFTFLERRYNYCSRKSRVAVQPVVYVILFGSGKSACARFPRELLGQTSKHRAAQVRG